MLKKKKICYVRKGKRKCFMRAHKIVERTRLMLHDYADFEPSIILKL